MKIIKLFFLCVSLALLFLSCAKDPSPAPAPPTSVTTGVYVLNQGSYGHNNTMLTYYDFTTSAATTDFFRNVNVFGLGDTGSDMITYGGKLYIVMNVSGYVAVSDKYTGRFTDTIDLKNAGINRGPQNIVGYGKNIFVSSTDGTVAVIDTTTLAIQKFITVGSNPWYMAISGSNLYVSNSGAFSANFEYDSTVSIVDMNSLTETGKITVGINPGSIAADSAGNIYISCQGDYGAVVPKLVKVGLADKKIVKSVDSALGIIRYYNGALYTTGGYSGPVNTGILSTSDLAAIRPSFVTDGTAIENPYGVDIDPATGNVYVTDAKDYSSSGVVFCFDNTGKLKFSFSTAPGMNPAKTQLIVK